MRAALPEARSLSVAEVLHWNGLLETPAASADELRAALFDLLQNVLQEFSAARAREGEKLGDFLLQRVEKIEALRNGVMPHVPAAIAAYEQKLIARLQEAMQNAPEGIWMSGFARKSRCSPARSMWTKSCRGLPATFPKCAASSATAERWASGWTS